MNSTRISSAATKIPQVTVVFWVMKILATTLGETGGDLLAQTMKIGYAVSTLILLAIMFATLAGQLRVRSFSPALYWTVIATTSMAGTTISDYIDRTLKWGYYKGSVVLVVLLVAALLFWKKKFGSLSISGVNRFSVEVMFWTTVLIANTLGTALGDWMSDNTGLGFGRATLVITALLGLVALLHFRTAVNKVALFWAAFVLIQPFGATAGDLVTKSREIGGMGFPTYYASAILTAVLIVLLVKTKHSSDATSHRHAPRRRPVATPSVAAAPPDRDLAAVRERWVPSPALAEDKAEAVVTVEAAEAVQIGRAIDELTAVLQSATEARQMLESARRMHAEAVELRANAERQAAEVVARAKAEAAQRTEEAERRYEEICSAETAVLDRLQQAAALWETVFRNARPPLPTRTTAAVSGPPDIETLDIREPNGIKASSGNGAH